jgi:hypothetical protein
MAQVILENETKTACQKDLERLLSEVEVMSDEEAQRRVGEINLTIANSNLALPACSCTIFRENKLKTVL